MARKVQGYVVGLLADILGPCEQEKRFEWARGVSGRTLPFDAVWQERSLIVEVDEPQHYSPVPFFDKPNKLTVSGVDRGTQRGLYDQKKAAEARANGYRVVWVDTRSLSMQREEDLRTLIGILRDAGLRVDLPSASDQPGTRDCS